MAKHQEEQMEKAKGSPSQLPPQIPSAVPELERAIMLLGSLVKAGRLREEGQRELVGLLGAFPSVKQAAGWKTNLSRLRKELLAKTTPAS